MPAAAAEPGRDEAPAGSLVGDGGATVSPPSRADGVLSGASAAGAASAEPRTGFQVLERTFAILAVFDEAQPEWPTSDVARKLGLPVPTTHRILSALRKLGYVSQDSQTKRFRLGPAALGLGVRARAVADLRTVALEPLRHLARALDETALLTVLSPSRTASVCLERVESLQPLRLSVEPGRQVPLHAGASQKALLAFMPASEASAIIAGPLERLCRSTLVDGRKLKAEIELTRERGFATSYEETNIGVWGIAVPVLSDSDVVCALGVAAPSARLSNEVVHRALQLAEAAAREVAMALGCSVPQVKSTAGSLMYQRRKRA